MQTKQARHGIVHAARSRDITAGQTRNGQTFSMRSAGKLWMYGALALLATFNRGLRAVGTVGRPRAHDATLWGALSPRWGAWGARLPFAGILPPGQDSASPRRHRGYTSVLEGEGAGGRPPERQPDTFAATQDVAFALFGVAL